MAIPQVGDRVEVDAELARHSVCEFVDRIAGKTGHVIEVDTREDEAFVVANPGDREGTYTPMSFLKVVS